MGKKHLINKNPNLTDSQKLEIIEMLAKYPDFENKVDWNKNKSLTYMDFYTSILRPLYLKDLNPKGLIEGKDYDIIYEDKDKKEIAYVVYTYDASRILASNNVEPKIWTELPYWCGYEEKHEGSHAFGYFDEEHGDMKPGAKWCISMQTSDEHWKRGSDFIYIFWFRKSKRFKEVNRKIAIEVGKDKSYSFLNVFNGKDDRVYINIPSYIRDSFLKKLKGIEYRLRPQLTYNSSTQRYDYQGSLTPKDLRYFVSEDKRGFSINFGEISGDFDCSDLGLKSLKGAPTTVDGSFKCSYNPLVSLVGSPKIVTGDFYCSCMEEETFSLVGSPKYVGGDFNCGNNKLFSLKGAPKEVGKDFICNFSRIITLEGLPKKIGGSISLQGNKLIFLVGSPSRVNGDFDCSYNQLTSLKGAPQYVALDFNCSSNETLTSLEGLPKFIGKTLDLSYNKGIKDFGHIENVKNLNLYNCGLKSLVPISKAFGKEDYTLAGSFECSHNKLTSLKGAPQGVGKYFSCSYNELTTLEGAPRLIGGNFDCYNNPKLSSVGTKPFEIRGGIRCYDTLLKDEELSKLNIKGCIFRKYY